MRPRALGLGARFKATSVSVWGQACEEAGTPPACPTPRSGTNWNLSFGCVLLPAMPRPSGEWEREAGDTHFPESSVDSIGDFRGTEGFERCRVESKCLGCRCEQWLPSQVGDTVLTPTEPPAISSRVCAERAGRARLKCDRSTLLSMKRAPILGHGNIGNVAQKEKEPSSFCVKSPNIQLSQIFYNCFYLTGIRGPLCAVLPVMAQACLLVTAARGTVILARRKRGTEATEVGAGAPSAAEER